jgi:peptidoglycan-associated lipoprotein
MTRRREEVSAAALLAVVLPLTVMNVACHSRKAGPGIDVVRGIRGGADSRAVAAAAAASARTESGPQADRKLVYEVVLSEDKGNFKFGGATIPEEAKTQIDLLVGQLKPDRGNAYIEIEGHTDSAGPAEYNYSLGLERAENIKRYLYEQYQVPLDRISVISYGEEKPIAPNNSRDGRAQNRRVVVKLFEAAADAMPQFPWPPPLWTARQVLPSALLDVRAGGLLGASFDVLKEALRKAAIFDWSVYAVGTDSFAVVSRMENIDDSGRPRQPRWGAETPNRATSFVDYLNKLLIARPGRYRVVVFVVTSRVIVAGRDVPDRAKMEALLWSGAGALPPQLHSVVQDEGASAEALIYEFYRASEDEAARLVTNSSLQGLDHLAGYGVWTRSELRQ